MTEKRTRGRRPADTLATRLILLRHDAGRISQRASLLLGGRRTGYTLHQCRHRFATAAYAGTRDIDAVQKLLGHSSPAVTSIYVDTLAEASRAAVDAAAGWRT